MKHNLVIANTFRSFFMLFRRSLLLAATLSFVASMAHAQNYPSKSLRIVVPFGAGGVADLTARTVAQKMSEGYGSSCGD